VTILGANLPASGWTLAVLVVGGAISLLAWRTVARLARWRPGATLGALLSLTVVVALTLTPKGTQPTLGVAACIPYDWHDFVYNVFHTGGGSAGDVFNFVLMFPLTFSLVLATRRVVPIVILSLLVPTAIEFLQTLLPGRSCAVSDMVTNSAGAVLGAVAGWVVELRSRRRRARPRQRKPGRQEVGP
jgi:glycopeptide antibiotics resistance protein